jgi:hypothetical protein
MGATAGLPSSASSAYPCGMMLGRRLHPRSCDRFSIATLLLALFVLVSGCTTTDSNSDISPAAKNTDEAKKIDYKRLVDSLASKNHVPKLIKGDFNNQYPVFAADYDWSEVDRIAKAVDVLIENAEEAWAHLVAGIEDDRYSLTIETDTSVNSSENAEVGRLCAKIVNSYIREAVPPLHIDDGRSERPTRMPGLKTTLANKSLFELQIEMCKQTIPFVESLESISAEQKRENVRQLNDRIASLQKSRKPIKREVRIFSESWCPINDADQAATLSSEK